MKTNMSDQLEGHLPKIRKIIFRIVRDSRVVDDLSQECCVRIIENEKMWSGKKGSLLNWMNGVARNTALTKFSKKSKKVDLTMPFDETLTDDVDKSEGEVSEDKIKWVCEQFSSLTDKQRQILYMRYMKKMSFIEIAVELNITPQGVGDATRIAIAKLQRRARKEGLLAWLLPWNWRFNFLKASTGNKFVEITALLCVLSFVATAGYFILSSAYPDNKLTDSSVNHTVLTEQTNFNRTQKNPIDENSVPENLKGLLAHWKLTSLKNTVFDSSGLNHHGVVKYSSESDIFNRYVSIDSESILKKLNGSSTFTLSFWASTKTHSFANAAAISLCYGSDLKATLVIYPFSKRKSHNTDGVRVYFNGNEFINQRQSRIRDNKLHHFLLVSRGERDHEMFVDGVSVGVSQKPRVLPKELTAIEIANYSPLKQNFHGVISNVRIYSRELDDNEITLLAKSNDDVGIHADKKSDISDLIGYWKLKQALDCIRDSSANGYDGKIEQVLNSKTSNEYVVSIRSKELLKELSGSSTFSISFWASANSYEKEKASISICEGKDLEKLLVIYPYDNAYSEKGVRVYYNGKNVINENNVNANIADGKYHHFVFISYGKSSQVIYVDGNRVAESNVPNKLSSNLTSIEVTSYSPLGQNYHGRVKDVAIYDRALSDDEIKTLQGSK